MKILLVEDDLEISEMVSGFLASEGFDIEAVYDGQTACRQFEENVYDMVLLDLMIPKLSGMEVMRKIRRKSLVPILILSAKDSDSDKALGLGLGADDYLTKPFSVTELLARIKANLRRANQYAQTQETAPAPEGGILTWGELTMDLERHAVYKNKGMVELTAKEFDILKLLIKNPKRVYTKEQIYSLIWNEAYLGDENAVNVHISRLRNKIEDNPRAPKYVITVWGIGYKLGELS